MRMLRRGRALGNPDIQCRSTASLAHSAATALLMCPLAGIGPRRGVEHPHTVIKAGGGVALSGMKCSKVVLKNVGPIEHGEIKTNKVNVFIGPNNTGKSIASRIMYGLWQLDESTVPFAKRTLFAGLGHKGRVTDPPFGSVLVARGAGIHVRDIITHGQSNGWIEVTKADSSVTRYAYDRMEEFNMSRILARLSRMVIDTQEDCMYVPAGRTGTMQSLLQFMQIRNDLLNTVWETLGEDPPPGVDHLTPKSHPSTRRLRQRRRIIPEHLERFNDLILETASDGLPEDAQKLFVALFHGTIESDDSYNMPQIYYHDPSGFVTKIDSAGSGTVSSFPIVASMHKVEAGGTLIVEEPEAHLEPLSQQKMITALVRTAQAKNVNLVFTTHSEYVVYPLLSMVSGGELKHSDLGIYNFSRTNGSYTRIAELPVSEAGEMDDELFEEAINALGTRL